MSIKFQYKGCPVEVDTTEEFFAIMNSNSKAHDPVAAKPDRTKPARIAPGQDRYRSFVTDLSQNPKKVATAIGSHSEILMSEVAKIVGAENNQQLSAWMTTVTLEAKKCGITLPQLWAREGPRGKVKITPTPALRAAVEGLREPKLSAVKQTA